MKPNKKMDKWDKLMIILVTILFFAMVIAVFSSFIKPTQNNMIELSEEYCENKLGIKEYGGSISGDWVKCNKYEIQNGLIFTYKKYEGMTFERQDEILTERIQSNVEKVLMFAVPLVVIFTIFNNYKRKKDVECSKEMKEVKKE